MLFFFSVIGDVDMSSMMTCMMEKINECNGVDNPVSDEMDLMMMSLKYMCTDSTF